MRTAVGCAWLAIAGWLAFTTFMVAGAAIDAGWLLWIALIALGVGGGVYMLPRRWTMWLSAASGAAMLALAVVGFATSSPVMYFLLGVLAALAVVVAVLSFRLASTMH